MFIVCGEALMDVFATADTPTGTLLDYLRLQKRFAHLFGAHPRPDIVARIQALAGLLGSNAA